ncbi:Zinc protease [Arcticibacter svalbardensis MN12-7]|uniref:Zinc protease n=1 Tax=Arcticibacter svalbardensis MN12-7 TaxID=1150600 RepID=R9GW88_9SPHI|nr:pitrilysin family protein [Arcticibacter svalbardensis]EOR93169.1 Zinc protease [Arcticibacter svalbardensis MN12-7]
MINRTIAPAYKEINQINLIQATPRLLDNNIKLFVVNAGEQELVRIEFIFNNVNWDVNHPLQAFITNSLLIEGSRTMSSYQISERIDSYGAFIQAEYGFDHSTFTLYTLSKHLDDVLPLVKEILTEATFPQEELDTFVRNQKQKLLISLEKNDVVTKRIFNNSLFGDSIYGYIVNAEDYDKVDRNQLVEYYKAAYQPNNCIIIASGKVDEVITEKINSFFGNGWENTVQSTKNVFSIPQKKGSLYYTEKPEALQSAIRIGQISIPRNHADFPALQFLNTVLGGYFGSRLMANIREEKGYTYGIGSGLVSLQNVGYFLIASEVGAEVCTLTLEEIEKEVNLLRTEPIPEEEIELVKNYMLGSFMGSLENAFSHADKFKSIYLAGLDYAYYTRYVQTIKHINAQQLLELANKYLDYNSFNIVITGKK